MKKIFPLILITLFAFSCNKEDDPIVSPYVEDGYITYEVKGAFKGYELDESGTLSIYSNYTDSEVISSSDNYAISLNRFSRTNIQSKIYLDLNLDTLGNYLPDEDFFFNIYLEIEDNTVVFIRPYSIGYDATDTIPYIDNRCYFQYSNLKFSPKSKTISGDYFYSTNSYSEEFEYTIQGSFKGQLYERAFY